MKKILFALIMLVMYTQMFAQKNVQPKIDDSKAREILEAASEKLKSYKSMKYEFTYTMENKKENIKETKKGVIYMKGDMYKLSIAGQEIINNGETQWTFIEEVNEVQVSDPSENEDGESLTPYQMLTTYADKYKTRFIREEVADGKTVQVVDLFPKKGGTAFYRTRLFINKANSNVISSVLSDRNGGNYTYKVNSLKTNLNLTKADFTFKPSNHPGVEIIDLR